MNDLQNNTKTHCTDEVFAKIWHNPIYEVSNYGRVRNSITRQILKATKHRNKNHKNGSYYYRIELKKPRKKYLVHRLVAESFILNPYNYDQINHKDKNGLNNYVGNLEWCNANYNIRYSQAKTVNQYDLQGNLLGVYDSLTDAANKTDSDYRLISAVCLGKRNTHNKYKWQYA